MVNKLKDPAVGGRQVEQRERLLTKPILLSASYLPSSKSSREFEDIFPLYVSYPVSSRASERGKENGWQQQTVVRRAPRFLSPLAGSIQNERYHFDSFEPKIFCRAREGRRKRS